MQRKKCFDDSDEDVVAMMGLGAKKTDDRWRHPEEYNQYGILRWMMSELVSMIWTLLYGSTSAENAKYVSKIGLKFVPNLRFFFLWGCLCLWLHQEILLFSEYQLSSWEALTSFSLKIQLLKILSLLHLKSCDVRILLDEIFKMMVLLRSENVKRTLNPPWYFIIRGRKGKYVLVPVTPKTKSVEVWWSLDREIAFLSIRRFIGRYTRCFEWRLNPSKHDLLSSNEGTVFC